MTSSDRLKSFKLYFSLAHPKMAGMIHEKTVFRVLYNLFIFTIFVLGFCSCSFQAYIKIVERTTGCYRREDLFVIVEMIHWNLLHIMFLSFLFKSWTKTADYFKIGKLITSGVFTYRTGLDEESKAIIEKGNDDIVRFVKTYAILASFALFGSALRDPVFGGWVHEEGSEVTIHKFYESYIPFKVNTWARYVVVSIFHFTLGFAVFLNALGNFAMLVNCAIHIKTQLIVLKRKLQMSHVYAIQNSANRHSYENILYSYLTETIQHHQSLIRLFGMFQNINELNFFASYVITSLLLCGAGYIFTSPDSNMRSSLAFLFVILAELAFVGANCYFGQLLINQSLEIQDIVYDLPWYEQSNKIRFLYKMLLMRCKNPFVPTAYGLKPMSFATFGEILQTSYSCFNLIFATRAS